TCGNATIPSLSGDKRTRRDHRQSVARDPTETWTDTQACSGVLYDSLRIPRYEPSGAAMRRRDFINLLGAAAMLCSTRSRAQQPSKTYLTGYLAITQIPSLIKALKDGLRKLGYIEGHNAKIEYRILSEGGASANMLAAELVK